MTNLDAVCECGHPRSEHYGLTVFCYTQSTYHEDGAITACTCTGFKEVK